jgi:hypothetical protein
MWNPYVPQGEGTGHGATLRGPADAPHPLPARAGGQFAPDPRAARAYQEINKVYATLTTFTDPLFRPMADGLQGRERAPGPGRR